MTRMKQFIHRRLVCKEAFRNALKSHVLLDKIYSWKPVFNHQRHILGTFRRYSWNNIDCPPVESQLHNGWSATFQTKSVLFCPIIEKVKKYCEISIKIVCSTKPQGKTRKTISQPSFPRHTRNCLLHSFNLL